ncbi:MAG: hypothetical protein ACR2QS_06905 [Woeseiaceae bacterium]
MKSRMNPLVFLASVAMFAGTSSAQETSPATASDPEVHQARALLQSGREDIVKDEMRFSEEEAADFWPVYERYQVALQSVRDRFADVLVSYTNAYRAGAVTEELAIQYVEEYLDIQKEELEIKLDYLNDFREVLPARKAGRFYQLENKIEVEIEYQLSLIVPLMDPV